MHGAAAGGGAHFALLLGSWWAMMALMMLPVTWPWLRALARLAGPPGGAAPPARWALLSAFVAGYLLVWGGFSAGAAALQLWLGPLAEGAPLRGSLLAGAGLYQLTPLKAACLKRCRSPFGFLLARWPLRPAGALRAGAGHGLFCLGCCWALMLLALGAGAAGWAWMAALTALVALEKLARPGPALAKGSGVLLLASGALSLLAS